MNLKVITTWKEGQLVVDKKLTLVRFKELGDKPVASAYGFEAIPLELFFKIRTRWIYAIL